MKCLTLVLGLGLCLGACRKREETVATESRQVTMRDERLNLDATSNQRFGAGAGVGLPPAATKAPAAPFVAKEVPESWAEAPASSFRLLNYRFGTEGEVYLSMSRGGVLDNANRWLNQFGKAGLDAAGMEALEKVETSGFEGVWVDIEGNFGGGMGQPAKDGYALCGIVAEKAESILTVKMIGPVAEVAAEKENLRKFVASLVPAE